MSQNFQPPLPPQPPPPLPSQPCPSGGKSRTTLLPPPPPPPEPPLMPWRPSILDDFQPSTTLDQAGGGGFPPFRPPPHPMFCYNNQMSQNFMTNNFQTYKPTPTYCQLNPDPDQQQNTNMEIVKDSNENQNVDDVDETEDFQRCAVCDIQFENELAFSRHCRGLIHCQRLLGKQKDAGLIEADPPRKPQEEVDLNLFRTKNVDPNKRDIMPDELGGKVFHEQYFCSDCSCSCSGPEAYEAHLKGKRHAKTLKSKLSAGIRVNSVIPSALRPPETEKPAAANAEAIETGQKADIQNVIDECPEPLIGLKYVVEYISPINPARYVCNLCEAKCNAHTIIPHLIGFKHRLKFMKEVRCDLYAEIQLCADDKSQQTELLITRCQELETEEARPPIVQRLEIFNKNKSASENLRAYLERNGRASPPPPSEQNRRSPLQRPPNDKRFSGEIDMDRLVSAREKSPPRRREKQRRRGRSRSRSRSRFDERPWLNANDFKRSSPGPIRSRRSRSHERSPVRDDRRDTVHTKREEPSIMKQLLQALVNASTNRADPDAIRLSTALTNAILKAKSQQHPPPQETRPLTTFPIVNSYSVPQYNNGGYSIPAPTYSKPPTKPKLGSSYYR